MWSSELILASLVTGRENFMTLGVQVKWKCQSLSYVWLFVQLTVVPDLPGCCVHGISLARMLEWVSIPFASRSSWPRAQTQVSSIAGIFFTVWATKKAE